MYKVASEGKGFRSFPNARYATDAIFLQAEKPLENLEEGRRHFLQKRILYGYKVEVSVMPIGLAIGSSVMFRGSVSNVDMYHQSSQWHYDALAKNEEDDGQPDDCIGSEKVS